MKVIIEKQIQITKPMRCWFGDVCPEQGTNDRNNYFGARGASM